MAARQINQQVMKTWVIDAINGQGEFDMDDTFVTSLPERPHMEITAENGEFVWVVQCLGGTLHIDSGKFEKQTGDWPKDHPFHGKTLMFPVGDSDE